MASVDHHSDAPLSVLQARTTKNKIFVVQVYEALLFEVIDGVSDRAECALETVE